MNNIDIPNIVAFNKCSEAGLDIFAPSIFLQGCNFRCPYCMNSKLAKGILERHVSFDNIKAYIQEDKSDFIMISGGEPTCANIVQLTNLLKSLKSLGCNIGMSTNGANSEVLKDIIPLINYIALDIKSHKSDVYDKISLTKNSMASLFASKALIYENKLNRDDFEYEIRTTLYPEFINEEAIREIGTIMRKDEKWVLQQFRHAKNMLDPQCNKVMPYDKDELDNLVEIAKEFSDHINLRYV